MARSSARRRAQTLRNQKSHEGIESLATDAQTDSAVLSSSSNERGGYTSLSTRQVEAAILQLDESKVEGSTYAEPERSFLEPNSEPDFSLDFTRRDGVEYGVFDFQPWADDNQQPALRGCYPACTYRSTQVWELFYDTSPTIIVEATVETVWM